MAILDNFTWGSHCDEASGNILDVLGTNDLTESGGVGAATGKLSGARDFEAGSSQYASHADATAFNMNGNQDFTLACWAQLESKPAGKLTIMAKGDNASGAYLVYYDGGVDRLRCDVFGASGFNSRTQISANSLGSPSISTWYFIVVRHDATADTISIQVNDGTVDSTAHSAGIYDSASLPFSLSWNQFSEFHDGLIDEPGIWKRVLTTGESTTLYNGGAGVPYPFSAGASGVPRFNYNYRRRRAA